VTVTEAMHDVGWILWSGTVGLESAIQPRIDAATAAGYSRISVSPLDVALSEDRGVTAADLGRRIADAGLGIVVDPVMNWYGGSPSPTSRFGRFTTDESLRMCEDLGAVSLTCVGQATDEIAMAQIVDGFGRLCDRAAAFGAQVHVEFTAIHAIRDLATAWAIVDGAGRANGGIVFDTWHFFRTTPDFALLERIPGDRIFAVQVDDALPEVVGTLRDDTQNRLMPGDGSFDLPRVIGVLDRIGGLSWVGPEVISPATAAMDPIDVARVSRARIEGIIREVRVA
jgi:sugar phosphate isomerase/epimerase